jgi:hypothetical protein
VTPRASPTSTGSGASSRVSESTAAFATGSLPRLPIISQTARPGALATRGPSLASSPTSSPPPAAGAPRSQASRPLAGAAAVFVAAWLLTAVAGGWGDIFSAEWAPLGVAAALGMLVCPQVSFTAGLLVAPRVGRRRHERRLPGAEVALLLRRTRVALAFGALSLASVGVYAFEFRAGFSSWYVLSVVPAAAALTLPLAAAALLTRRAAAVKSSVPGDAGDVFDDLPVELPRRPWLLLAATAGAAALAGLVAGGFTNEGPRNAVAELVLVVAGFLAFGKRLGLRR